MIVDTFESLGLAAGGPYHGGGVGGGAVDTGHDTIYWGYIEVILSSVFFL